MGISIHALLAESDAAERTLVPPAGVISIHALLAESDAHCFMSSKINTNFYPRSPCGERRNYGVTLAYMVIFLSTLSLRRATRMPIAKACSVVFLSTLSLRRATKRFSRLLPKRRFLSTLSLRRATAFLPTLRIAMIYFYPRSPCGERQY